MDGYFLQHLLDIYEVGASWTLTEFAKHFFNWITGKWRRQTQLKPFCKRCFVRPTIPLQVWENARVVSLVSCLSLTPCLWHDIVSTISAKLVKKFNRSSSGDDNRALASSFVCTSSNWLFTCAILTNLNNFVKNSVVSSGQSFWGFKAAVVWSYKTFKHNDTFWLFRWAWKVW